jgi:hypothetical protein
LPSSALCCCSRCSFFDRDDDHQVENVVHAFFKLEEALAPGSPAAGQVPRTPCDRSLTRSFVPR